MACWHQLMRMTSVTCLSCSQSEVSAGVTAQKSKHGPLMLGRRFNNVCKHDHSATYS